MADAMSRWRGKNVGLVYANQTIAPTAGKIQDVDASGIVIDLPSGRTYIPYVAILQIVGPADV